MPQHTLSPVVEARPSLAACPHCDEPRPTFLSESSQDASVDYFRCAACGHVCHTPKGQAETEPKCVMVGQG